MEGSIQYSFEEEFQMQVHLSCLFDLDEVTGIESSHVQVDGIRCVAVQLHTWDSDRISVCHNEKSWLLNDARSR